jgi:hypothetical protein
MMTATLVSKPSTQSVGSAVRSPRPRNIGHVATRSRTLLEPGHEAEWAELNREKREYHQRTARALTPSERIAA